MNVDDVLHEYKLIIAAEGSTNMMDRDVSGLGLFKADMKRYIQITQSYRT